MPGPELENNPADHDPELMQSLCELFQETDRGNQYEEITIDKAARIILNWHLTKPKLTKSEIISESLKLALKKHLKENETNPVAARIMTRFQLYNTFIFSKEAYGTH